MPLCPCREATISVPAQRGILGARSGLLLVCPLQYSFRPSLAWWVSERLIYHVYGQLTRPSCKRGSGHARLAAVSITKTEPELLGSSTLVDIAKSRSHSYFNRFSPLAFAHHLHAQGLYLVSCPDLCSPPRRTVWRTKSNFWGLWAEQSAC